MTASLEPESKYLPNMTPPNNNLLGSSTLSKTWKLAALSSIKEAHAHQIEDLKVGEPQPTIESLLQEFMRNSPYQKSLIFDSFQIYKAQNKNITSHLI